MNIRGIISTVLKYTVLLAIVGYLVFVALKVARPVEDTLCTGVELKFDNGTDLSLIDSVGVNKILSSHNVEIEGKAFSAIDIPKIDSLLMSNPYIDSVITYPNSANKLCIRLRTAQPLLHVIQGSGREFYLDSNGNILPSGGQNLNLCIVTGSVSQVFAKENLLSIGKFLRDDPYWKLQAQQINVTPRGEIQLVPRTGDHLLILGDATNIADKLGRIRVFYEKGLPQAGWNTYKTISAEYDGQLVCTRR